MSEISGYTPEEWVSDDDAKLVITDKDNNEVVFAEHYKKGEPAWPPLEPNGNDWYIEK